MADNSPKVNLGQGRDGNFYWLSSKKFYDILLVTIQ